MGRLGHRWRLSDAEDNLVDNRALTPYLYMTETTTEEGVPQQFNTAGDEVATVPASRIQTTHPVLEKLFELYPHLFGAEFLPVKLGVFQDLLAAHPDHFQRDTLKLALGVHTRSTRYLQCVGAGKLRRDLQGQVVEPVAPEHVYMSSLELFRRWQARTKEDLRVKLRAQLMAAFDASGLSRQDYLAKVQGNDPQNHVALEEAFAEREQKLAKQAALLQTFEASGKTPKEFADMYGMDAREVARAIESRRTKELTLT
jgi:ProP effector